MSLFGWFNKNNDEDQDPKTENNTKPDLEVTEFFLENEDNLLELESLSEENLMQETDTFSSTEKNPIEHKILPNGTTEKPENTGVFAKLFSGLTKTRQSISGKLGALIGHSKALNDEFYEELEEILLQADVGVTTTMELMATIEKRAAKERLTEPMQIVSIIQEEITKILSQEADQTLHLEKQPAIFMLVGVNGAGKTTSIAKLAHSLQQEGKRVLLVAADTFRAAAIDQLQIWADRTGVPIVRREEGSDPGAVVYDAMQVAADYDVVLIDTAGRLQNKTNLMQEIAKLKKIIDREIPSAPHEILLVLDATTGQNAVSQAKQFMEATGITGIILTKLDGTAKGGIVITIAHELKVPVKLIGIGEAMDDLKEFRAIDFSQALFNEEANT